MEKMLNDIKKGWLGIAITLLTISISLLALLQSCEANKISKDISDLTNRPYILIDNIVANRGSQLNTGEDTRLPIEYQFSFLNNGTLPAWILKYEIYTNGTNDPIHLIFDPTVKPVKNFTIAKDQGEIRGYRSMLIQKPGEKNGHVDSFEAQKHKMILITVSYRTMGDTESKNVFTTWQLAKFGMRQNMECGTNALSEDDIKRLFREQEEVFERNEAK